MKNPRKTKRRKPRPITATLPTPEQVITAQPQSVDDDSIPTKMDITIHSAGPTATVASFVQNVLDDLRDSKWVSRELRYPADWWQAFKDRWFPEWALKRWPIEWEVRQWMERQDSTTK